jgi:hypothetical protein
MQLASLSAGASSPGETPDLDESRPDERAARVGLWFAGLQLSFEGPRTVLEHLARVPLAVVESSRLEGVAPQPADASRVAFASLSCRVIAATGHDVAGPGWALGSRGIHWQCHEGGGMAVTQRARARWQSGAAGFSAEATVVPSQRAAEGLLLSLASALLHRAGGAILHCASVELPEGVVAFVGPSGSGKSTACRHVSGASQFSLDRLAVVPVAGEAGLAATWLACPLPGGTPFEPSLPTARSRARPLQAVFRMRQADHGCRLGKCSTSQAVALLRESAFHAGSGGGAELELLAQLERLALSLPVANLHFSLGTSLGPLLRRWLSGGEPWPGEPA